jgi:hypothetical protein
VERGIYTVDIEKEGRNEITTYKERAGHTRVLAGKLLVQAPAGVISVIFAH